MLSFLRLGVWFLADKLPSRRLDDPKPGYFLVRVVKGGPLVPAAIIYEFGVWRAVISGEEFDAREDPLRAEKVLFIWHGFREQITRDEYLQRLGLAADHTHPSSRPREVIDLATEPPIF